MSKKGNNGVSFYVWKDNAKFDRYYDNKNTGDNFSKLNYIANGLSSYKLWNIQKEKLRKAVKENNSIESINRILKNLPSDLAFYEDNQLSENNISSSVYNRVIQILNEGLRGEEGLSETLFGTIKDANFEKSSKEWDDLADNVKELYKELKGYVEKGYIDERSLLLFTDRFRSVLEGVSAKGLAPSFYQYIGKGASSRKYEDLKAKEAEYLVEEMIKNNPVLKDAFGAIASGQMYVEGMVGQMVQDAFIYEKAFGGRTNFKGGVAITFKEKGTGKEHTVYTWEEFERKIKKLNSQKISIELTNKSYDLLKDSRAVAIQVKSHRGGPESIINKSGRFAITMKNIQLNTMLFVKLLKLGEQTDLKKISSIDYNKEDENLALVANWFLSKHILNTELVNNDLYFTEYGLETAADWMERNKKMLGFTPAMNKASMFLDLDKRNNYGFIRV